MTALDWDSYHEGEAHGIESQQHIIEELTAQRDSARDWAAALENRIAKALDLARFYSTDAFGYDEIAAALTGGEDE